MSERPQIPEPLTAERRNRAVDELCGHFAAGHLELDVLEERLSAVEGATSEAELQRLVADLPALPAVVEAAQPTEAEAAALTEPRSKRGWALALLGGNSRKGMWRPPQQLNAVALLGGVELDFRNARLPAGETHVTAVAVMGGIEIVVPPGLAVTVRGLGIMGGVDQTEHTAESLSPNTPHLKITAFALMGGVGVETRAREDEDS
jgi:hypothetical protein